VSAVDPSNNASATSSTVSTTTLSGADLSSPTTPTGLTVTTVATSSVVLTWASSTDNVAVTAYRVYRNNTFLATSSAITYTATGLATSTLYSFNVSAVDAANNASATTTSVSTTTLIVDAPILPLAYVDTTYSLPVGGTTWRVNVGGDLQAALNSAALGDVIELAATGTFTGPFTLPNKASGSGWIYIVSNQLASLPAAGTRVTPLQATYMPKIVTNINNVSAIASVSGSHHYRFVGVEVKPTTGIYTTNLIALDNGDTSTTTLPHHIIFDRSYVHGGDIATNAGRRGFYMSGTHLAVVDSYVSGFFEDGSDSQAIQVTQGDGPFKIANNYLEAASENVNFGGVDPQITDSVPSDIEIVGNHFYKPLEWIGAGHNVKNLLEFKNAHRVLVRGNIFENNWADGQSGFSLLLTPRNQDGGCPWCGTQDITIEYNKWLNVGAGINLLAQDGNHPSQRTTRVLIQHNVLSITDPNPGNASDNRIFQMLEGPYNVAIKHNTAFLASGGASMVVTGSTADTKVNYFDFSDNIVSNGSYGFFGQATAPGTPTLDLFFTNHYFTKNVFIGGSGSYPALTYFPASTTDVGFVHYEGGDYSLTSTSTYHDLATDGTDIGANITTLTSLLSGVDSAFFDLSSPTTPTGLTVTTVATSSVVLTWASSTDNVAVTAYRVYRNNTFLATSSAITYTATGLATSTLYSFNVSAVDAANNASATTTSVSTTTLIVDAPILPLAYVDTTYSLPVGGTTWRVNVGGDLQAALNSAALGDVIELAATGTFTGPFTLPNKASGSGWIYIVSNQLASLPAAGSRVTSAYAAHMPDIVVGVGSSAITADTNAHHYRFVGIEIKPIVSNFIYNLVDIGTGASFTTNGVMPHHIIFDRSYIHGDVASPAGRRGIALNGTDLAVVDSQVSGFYEPGADSQAIWGFQGDGPIKIVNNYLEAGAENVMFGGGDPRIANSVPSDIEIRGNHFYKPLGWIGANFVVKNLLEFKNAQRVLVQGNIFENNWLDGQSGYALVITPRNQDGGCSWCVTKDITVRYNKMINTGSGVSLMGRDTNPGYTTQITDRISIDNNIIIANGLNGATGWGFLLTNGFHNTSITHNTIITHSFSSFTSTSTYNPYTHFNFKDNMIVGGTGTGYYEWIGDGKGNANTTLDAYFSDYTFTSNVMVGASSLGNPAGNFFPANTGAVGFTDYAGGNYLLTGGSSYHNAASDGTDIGANITALNTELASVPSPVAVLPSNFFNWGVETTKVSYGTTSSPYNVQIFGTTTAPYDTPIFAGVGTTTLDCTVSHSGSCSMKLQVAGADSGNQQLGVDIIQWNPEYPTNFVGASSTYYRWWMKIMPGFNWGSGTAKAKSSRLIGTTDPRGYTGYLMSYGFLIGECDDVGSPSGGGCQLADGTANTDGNLYIPYDFTTKDDGTWHQYTIKVKPNTNALCTTPGTCDAEFQAWVDNVSVGEYNNFRLHNKANNKMNEAWGGWMISPYFQLNGSPTDGGTIYLDDFSTDNVFN
jgi:chitodextrinase